MTWTAKRSVGFWALSLAVLVAVGIRLYRLDHQSFWIDEVLSVEAAKATGEGGLANLLSSRRGPLYQFLLSGLVNKGASEFRIRLPSAMLGTGLVLAGYLMARKLLSSRDGLSAAWVLAVSPFAVWYSQEARYVILFILLGTLSTLLAHQLREHGCTRHLVSYVLCSLLMLFSFVGGVFLLVAQNIWLVLTRPARDMVLRWALAQVMIGVVFVPWMMRAYGVAAPVEGESSTRPFEVKAIRTGSSRHLNPLHAGYALYAFGVGYSLGPSQRELHEDLTLGPVRRELHQVAAGILLIGAVGTAGLARVRQNSKTTSLLLFLCVVCPVVGVYLMATVSGVAFNVRYAAGAFPAFAVILAAGVWWWLERGRWGWLLVLVAGLLQIFCLWNYFENPRYAKEDNRGASRLVAEMRRPEEPLIVGEEWRGFDFYYQQSFYTLYQVELIKNPSAEDQHRAFNTERIWVAATRTWENRSFERFLDDLQMCYAVEKKFVLPGFEVFAFMTGPKASSQHCALLQRV